LYGNQVIVSIDLLFRKQLVLYIVAHVMPLHLCTVEAVVFSLCPDVSPDVPCQHGLVHRAGLSITRMQQRRHHMTACSLKLTSFCSFSCASLTDVTLLVGDGWLVDWSLVGHVFALWLNGAS